MRSLYYPPLDTVLFFSQPPFVSSVMTVLCLCRTRGRTSGALRWQSGCGSHLLFGFNYNSCGSSAVTFHLCRWMAAIVCFKERNVRREEGVDGFLYLVSHSERRADSMQKVASSSWKMSPWTSKEFHSKADKQYFDFPTWVQLNRSSRKC